MSCRKQTRDWNDALELLGDVLDHEKGGSGQISPPKVSSRSPWAQQGALLHLGMSPGHYSCPFLRPDTGPALAQTVEGWVPVHRKYVKATGKLAALLESTVQPQQARWLAKTLQLCLGRALEIRSAVEVSDEARRHIPAPAGVCGRRTGP